MHIVFFGLDLNHPFQPTAARVAYELSKKIVDAGHQATIITIGKHAYIENSINFIGVPLQPYPSTSNIKYISNILEKLEDINIINGIGGLYSMFFGSQLFRYFKISYIHTLTTGGFPSLNFNKRKVKAIWDFTLDLGFKNPLVTSSTIFWSPRLMRYFNGNFNIKGIITPSSRLLNFIEKYYQNRKEESILYHIPFGVDTKRFSPIQLNQNDQVSKIVYFGHANRHRGFPTLIRSFKLINDIFPKIQLDVFTPSPPPFSIKDKKNIKIKTRIEKNIDVLIKTAKIIALPFNFAIPELPLTILESMACGNAVITTNILGIPEVIEGDVNGILIDTYDSKELAKKLLQLLNNENLVENLGSSARKKSLIYDWKIIVKKYIEIYNKVLNESR